MTIWGAAICFGKCSNSLTVLVVGVFFLIVWYRSYDGSTLAMYITMGHQHSIMNTGMYKNFVSHLCQQRCEVVPGRDLLALICIKDIKQVISINRIKVISILQEDWSFLFRLVVVWVWCHKLPLPGMAMQVSLGSNLLPPDWTHYCLPLFILIGYW